MPHYISTLIIPSRHANIYCFHKKQIFLIMILRNICFSSQYSLSHAVSNIFIFLQYKNLLPNIVFKSMSVCCLSSSCNNRGSEVHRLQTRPVDWQYRQPYSHSSIKKRFGYCHFWYRYWHFFKKYYKVISWSRKKALWCQKHSRTSSFIFIFKLVGFG